MERSAGGESSVCPAPSRGRKRRSSSSATSSATSRRARVPFSSRSLAAPSRTRHFLAFDLISFRSYFTRCPAACLPSNRERRFRQNFLCFVSEPSSLFPSVRFPSLSNDCSSLHLSLLSFSPFPVRSAVFSFSSPPPRDSLRFLLRSLADPFRLRVSYFPSDGSRRSRGSREPDYLKVDPPEKRQRITRPWTDRHGLVGQPRIDRLRIEVASKNRDGASRIDNLVESNVIST